ncbi:MAG: hypothetical protein H6609_18750 [Ignavibacteriales bacterium]|nr:hypothetical protein [Ignavibacteriales bacterium]
MPDYILIHYYNNPALSKVYVKINESTKERIGATIQIVKIFLNGVLINISFNPTLLIPKPIIAPYSFVQEM